jgi:pentatricopeptide repeat protein
MGRLIDLNGRKLGRWMVLAIHPKRVRYGRARRAVSALWRCRCSCGVERLVHGTNLRQGLSLSCGCLSREKVKERSTKHGHARRGNVTRAYSCWVRMKQRCFNPNQKDYPNYGARGISVCERWLEFANFYEDMGDPPPGLTLDRIDNDRGYGPGNVRWATAREQVLNRRGL